MTTGSGTLFDNQTYATLPEMEVSFARGFVLQLRILITDDQQSATLIEWSRAAGDSTISLRLKGTTLELDFQATSGALVVGGKKNILKKGVWNQVAVAIGAQGICFYLDGVSQGNDLPLSAGLLPVEIARGRNFIGKAPDAAPVFTGALADVRLWNRADALQEILVRGSQSLVGDEAGLFGYWTLEGANGKVDGSPFGHDATLAGPLRPGSVTYSLNPASGGYALDAKGDPLLIDNLALGNGGSTVQVYCCLRSQQEGILFSYLGPTGSLDVLLHKSGRLEVVGHTASGHGVIIGIDGALKVGTWTALALRVNLDSSVSLFIGGKLAGSAQSGGFQGSARLMTRPFDGLLAELRIWSRPLASALIADTTNRKIHGWAPGLIGCWRLDEAPGSGTPMNIVPGGPVATSSKSVLFSLRGSLNLASPPQVRPARVITLSAGGGITLPPLPAFGGGGFTLQFYLKVEGMDAGPILHLRADHADINLSLSNLGLQLAYQFDQPGRLLVPDVFTLQRWAQITLTVRADGLLCIYRDGVLIVRENSVKPASATFNHPGELGAGPFSITELRIWQRALTESEVYSNYKSRIAQAPGLVGRWSLLDGALTGTPGALTGTATWRDAPSLPLPKVAPPTSAAIEARSTVIADQSGKAGASMMAVLLRALNQDGQAIPAAVLQIIAEKDTHFSVGKLQMFLPAGVPTKLTVGPQGSVRMVIAAAALTASVLRVRHDGMGEGEWALVSPDEALIRKLASVTATELQNGRRPGQPGLVSADGDKLARILRNTLGAAANFSFEKESTAALAFGTEQASVGEPVLGSESGVRAKGYTLREDQAIVRRVGLTMPPAVEGVASEAVSFGAISDWLSSEVSLVEHTAQTVIDGVASITKVVVSQIAVAINTTINGLKVVGNWVIATVEDAAQAVVDVFKALGKALWQVIDFIADMFEWDDFVQGAVFVRDALTKSMETAKSSCVTVMNAVSNGIRDVEQEILTLLGGVGDVTSSVSEQSADHDHPEIMEPLDYLISLLPDDIEKRLSFFVHLFDPIAAAIESAVTRLPMLADGVVAEFNQSSLVGNINSISDLLQDGKQAVLTMMRIVVRLIANAICFGIDLARDLIVGIIQVFETLWTTPIDLGPVSTFLQTAVLSGQPLTVGLIFGLGVSIPVTILYKLISGQKHGPFVQSSSLHFAATTDKQLDTLDMLSRSIAIPPLLMSTIIDPLGCEDKQIKDNKVIGGLVLLGNFLAWVYDLEVKLTNFELSTDPPWSNQTGWEKASTIFDWGGSVITAIQLAVTAIGLYLDSDGTGKAATVIGWIGGIASAGSAVPGIMSDDGGVEVAVSVIDGIESVCSVTGSIAAEITNPYSAIVAVSADGAALALHVSAMITLITDAAIN